MTAKERKVLVSRKQRIMAALTDDWQTPTEIGVRAGEAAGQIGAMMGILVDLRLAEAEGRGRNKSNKYVSIVYRKKPAV
jgi:hypothetical protein